MNVDNAISEVNTNIRPNPEKFSPLYREVAIALAAEVERLRAELAEVKHQYHELACAVWACSTDETIPDTHQETVEEAKRDVTEAAKLRLELAEAKAAVLVSDVITAIESEEEFDGDIPKDIFATASSSAEAMAEALRVVCRLTKKGIKRRVEALRCNNKPPVSGGEEGE